MIDTSNTIFSLSKESTPATYYRSALFTVTQGDNALVVAATPLLSLVPLIKENTDLPQLYQMLIHEMKVFETKLQQGQARYETIMAARYALCATLDEVVARDINNHLTWQNYSLLHHFHQEHLEKNRFFVILERLQQNPDLHIELLELFYLCLTLGFSNHEAHIEKFTTELYQCIRAVQHGHDEIKIHHAPTHTLRRQKYWFPLASCGLLLLLTFIGFIYIFTINLNPIYRTLETINQQMLQGEEEY